MFKKIIIGTAQFGQRYGISKNTKALTREQIGIINYGSKNRIRLIDTAPYYGDIEACFRKYNIGKFEVILKFRSSDILKKLKKNDDIYFFFENSIKKKFPNVKYLLLYDFEKLRVNQKKKIYNFVLDIKKKKLIKKFGYTIYSFNKINNLCEIFKPDIIQCPFNLIDRRLVKKKYLDYFKKKKIEVHARSIFLQGLLLMKKEKILKKFKRFKYIFEKWENWLLKNNLNPVEVCWNYVASYKKINNYVVGFHELNQIKELNNIRLKSYNFPNISSNNQNLINPGKWR